MAQFSRILPLVIASALFMENMDSTVIATSLPTMAADLGVDPVMLKLAFTTYLLSLTVFIPISGWCADRFGARHVFRAAIAVFTVGSVACGLSQSLEGLVAARAVQGLGGAMMVPVGRLILLRTVPKSQLVDALAYLTIPALIGPLIGPPLGGFITTYFHWRWIFWINIPVGLVAIALATALMPDVRANRPARLDGIGFLLSGVGLSSLVFGLTVAGRNLLPGGTAWLLVVIGAVFLLLYIRHARRSPEPILDLRLLRLASFRAGVVGGSLFRIGVGATPFLLPLLLQLGLGLSAFQSGLLTCASVAGAVTMKFTVGRVLKRYGFRSVLVVNGVVSALFIAASAAFTTATPFVVIAAVLLLGGFFRSLQFTALNALSYADLDSAEMSRATSLYTVAQQLSLAGGVALAAFVLETAQQLRGDVSLVPADFSTAFLAVGLVSLLSIFSYRRLPADAGSEVSGRRTASGPAAAE
jgi:EmrB/QacA subfamily drug resistance transporter